MSKLHFSQEFYRKSFTAEEMKDAYMKAIKWYATNVLSKDELHNVQVEFEKKTNEQQLPTVVIHLFAVLSEKEVFDQHCQCCKEMHRSFFINENNNCNICAAAGYQNRLEQKIEIKRSYYAELIKKRMGE